MNGKPTFLEASKDFNQGNYTRSLAALNTLIDTQKDEKTYVLLAKNLLKLGFKADAARAYVMASKMDTSKSVDHIREAMRLHLQCGNDDDVLVLGSKVLLHAQKDAEIAFFIAAVLLKRDRTTAKKLLKPFRKVLSESSDPNHHTVAAHLLTDDLRDDGNLRLARNLFNKHSNHLLTHYAFLIFCREFCDYDAIQKHQKKFEDALAAGNYEILSSDNPFYNLTWCDNEAANRFAMFNAASPYAPEWSSERRKQPHNWSDKVRIGYVSSDLWSEHATMKLFRHVLELHDPERFDVTLFCHTDEERIKEDEEGRPNWGRIVRINHLSNPQAAELIRAMEIDILVDLKGYTSGTRNQIFNLKTAPIHVSWLGFPGSSVNIDLDYIIGDRYVLPDAAKPHYHERFCRLPDTYQPNDPVYRPQLRPATRSELKLPEDVFVFASFNANRKISLATIELWGRILKRARNSILWIMATHPRVKENITKKLAAQGISSKRIVFMPSIKYIWHMNRMQLGDLALDTFPYNGHTTTSEQLWAGLPVLTVKGTHFASRVTESLLNAIGLPDLVAEDLKAYEDMAVELYENPERLSELKKRLNDNRYVEPLFDGERFYHHLEKAYEMMVERAKLGLEPDHFDVPALPRRQGPFFTVEAAPSGIDPVQVP